AVVSRRCHMRVGDEEGVARAQAGLADDGRLDRADAFPRHVSGGAPEQLQRRKRRIHGLCRNQYEALCLREGWRTGRRQDRRNEDGETKDCRRGNYQTDWLRHCPPAPASQVGKHAKANPASAQVQDQRRSPGRQVTYCAMPPPNDQFSFATSTRLITTSCGRAFNCVCISWTMRL